MTRILLLAVVLLGLTGWTDERVRVTIPVAAGNSQDMIGRRFTEQLAIQTGRTMFVENKPGAATTTGTKYFLTNEPNTNILWTSSVLVSSYYTIANVDYNITEDLTPICVVSSSPLVMVTRKGIDTPEQFLEAKNLTYAQVGYGGVAHYATEMFLKELGITAQGIPYRGSSEAIVDLLAGRVDFLFFPVDLVKEHVAAGKINDTGIESPLLYWNGIFVQSKASDQMKAELRKGCATVMADKKFTESLNVLGINTYSTSDQTPENLARFMSHQINQWSELSKMLGFERR